MKYLILIPLSTLLLEASLLDFKYLEEAKEAYNDKNYTKAQALYGKVNLNEAKFNQADSLYRDKKYKEAIDLYKQINDPKLEAKKLHNIGNSYAQIKKIDEAIKAYEEALKINNDVDTKFNLELLKKKKEEEKKQKNKDNKDNKDKKNNKNDKNNQDKNKQENQDKNQEQKNKQSQEQNKKDKSQEEKDKDKESEAQKRENQKKQEEEEKKRKEAQMGEQNQTQPPISNMEERKWQKMLNQRGVNTLMIPLNKGKKDNETNLW
jgi:Ca-activated chloride channel family protein